jgi:hypothetical protein
MHAGLGSAWPRWDYDVAGVIRREVTDFKPKPGAVPPSLDRLPGLDQESLPDAYTIQPLPGSKWNEQNSVKTMEINHGLASTHVCLDFIEPSSDAAAKLLPGASVLDQCVVKGAKVGGAPAWKIDLQVDRAANPNYPFRYQQLYLFPMANGWLQLRFESNEEGLTVNSAAIQQLIEGLKFTWRSSNQP